MDYADEFGGMAAVNLSRQLPPVYERIAQEEGCIYLNGADCAGPSQADGLHLDEAGTPADGGSGGKGDKSKK